MFANDGDTLVSCARAWCPEQALERIGRDAFESNSGVSLRVCRMSFPKKKEEKAWLFFSIYMHICVSVNVCHMPHVCLGCQKPRIRATVNTTWEPELELRPIWKSSQCP